jgi:hypothetical protein
MFLYPRGNTVKHTYVEVEDTLNIISNLGI